jgi:hypothetical protein
LVLGDWHQAIAIHAFSPLAAALLGLMAYICFAPAAHRRWIVQYCGQIELKTGLSLFVIALFLAYWGIRFLFFREVFYHLVL